VLGDYLHSSPNSCLARTTVTPISRKSQSLNSTHHSGPSNNTYTPLQKAALPELIPISFGLREYMLEEEAQQQKIVLSRLSWTVRPIDLVFKTTGYTVYLLQCKRHHPISSFRWLVSHLLLPHGSMMYCYCHLMAANLHTHLTPTIKRKRSNGRRSHDL
jgi:hypothetical protein